MEKIILVSADGHAGAPPSAYGDYIESKYKSDLQELEKESEAFAAAGVSQRRYSDEKLDLIDPRGAIRGDGELGAWELDRRLRELDREGIAAEVLIYGVQLATLPFFSVMNFPCSAELRTAGVRAYHRWLADFMAASGGRLYGIADPGTCLDMAETVKELRFVGEHGFVGVHPPGQVDDTALPPLYDPYYEPFWATCAELRLVVNVHAGYGTAQGQFPVLNMREMTGNLDDEKMLELFMTGDLGLDKLPYDAPFRLFLNKPRRALWQLMLGGVFDRHPTLKVVLTEVRADWIPDTIDHLDSAFDSGRLPTARRPSEYWESNFAVTPSSPRPYELALRHRIGIDRLLFGADYPHPEGTWPNTWDWIRNTFAGIPEEDARKILGENAIRIYGLDPEPLAKLASKIGPTPADVLGSRHRVEERLVQTFHERSGYNRPAENVDPAFMDSMIADDVVGAGRV